MLVRRLARPPKGYDNGGKSKDNFSETCGIHGEPSSQPGREATVTAAFRRGLLVGSSRGAAHAHTASSCCGQPPPPSYNLEGRHRAQPPASAARRRRTNTRRRGGNKQPMGSWAVERPRTYTTTTRTTHEPSGVSACAPVVGVVVVVFPAIGCSAPFHQQQVHIRSNSSLGHFSY